MSIEVITILLFGSMIVMLLTGFPLAFGLGSIGLGFTLWLWNADALYMVTQRAWCLMTEEFILLAIPLFIFMAMVLQHSGIADDLYEMMYRWFGPLRGGLAIGTVLICTVFAAMSGVSAAATVTMGVIALPSMLRRNYDKQISLGCIQAGGALGILIPPSTDMIIWCLFAEQSVGRMFMGGVFPGILLSSLFIIYIAIRCLIQKKMGPSIPPEERSTFREKIASLRAVILPLLIVVMVLGSIYLGVATPTEAAAMGAIGALISAIVYRRFSWQLLREATYGTVKLSGMIMWIILGALVFVSVYNAVGAADLIRSIFVALPGGKWGMLAGMQVTYFILGCFITTTAIILLTVPVFIPAIVAAGFDPLWFGILFVIQMEMALLTPPFGYNLFYMKSVVPKGITMGDIYRSVWPFVLLQLVGLMIVIIFPRIATWLPNMMITPHARV